MSENSQEDSPPTTPTSMSSPRSELEDLSLDTIASELAAQQQQQKLYSESEDEGEDLYENVEKDYKAVPELDNYDLSDLDERDFGAIDPKQRAKAEAALKKRDRLEGRLPTFMMDDMDEDVDIEKPKVKRLRRRIEENAEEEGEEGEELVDIDLTDLKGKSMRDWISIESVRRTVGRQFERFLQSYLDDKGDSVYAARIKAMCQMNGESLLVNFEHLQSANQMLALYLINCPSETLSIFDEYAQKVVLNLFEDYGRIHSEIHVRIEQMATVDTLRDLRHTHINTLIQVTGVVTRRTSVFPQLKYVKYDCGKCGSTFGPFYQDTSSEIRVGACPECQAKGPFTVNSEQTVYRNYQKITLQESPGTVPAGRLPRQKDVVLLWDLIDSARPGEEIQVTGIYKNNFDISLNSTNGFPVFATLIEANYISKKEDQFASFKLTEDDQKTIRDLARDPNIGRRIVKSIAPSIYGHDDIKTAIALALFAGEPKNVNGKHRLRGDINILLLGDPGTAKSQFLKYAEKTAHRSVFATGQGASAVGLTASVHRDPVTREWTLEGGALVLADKGVCCIDEFDKMNEADRTSIHEAMEQQSISISKAGIVTSLQARCAIVAAANPVKGRYDSSLPFSQNVNLTDPILSRFDILCVVKDIIDPVQDERLAEFVIGSHIKSHPTFNLNGQDAAESQEQDPEIIDQDTLKKYIMHAKDHIHPKLQEVDSNKISQLYAQMRQEAQETGSIPITTRHLESIIRIAESSAKMHLRDNVRSDDVDLAISVTLNSFINAQKYSVMKQMRKTFAKYLTVGRDYNQLLDHILSSLIKIEVDYYKIRHPDSMPSSVKISCEDFEMKARELNLFDYSSFYESLRGTRTRIENRKIIHTF